MTAATTTAVASQVEELLLVQRERAAAYAEFDAGFRSYLASANDAPYRALIGVLTPRFQTLSLRVRAVEAAWRVGRPDLAVVAQSLQQAEKRKLELTLGLQTLRAAVEHKTFSWQQNEEEEEEGAGAGHEGCAAGTCTHESHDEMIEEASEEDVTGAIKESWQKLEECIAKVNEAIDELQEARGEAVEEEVANGQQTNE